MAELGQLLRETRESKGLSLADAEKATRIRASYLEALETEDYGQLPGEVYTRGFLRNYARFLGLVPEDVLAAFDPSSRAKASAVSSEGRLDLDIPISVPLHSAARRNAGWIVLAVLLGLALGLGGWWLVRTYVTPAAGRLTLPNWPILRAATATSSPTMTPTTLPSATPGPGTPTRMPTATATRTRPAPTATPTATMTGTNTPTPLFSPTPTATPLPTDTPTATLSPTPKVYRGVELQIEITEVSWVRVAVDGVQVFEGELQAGETRVWEGTRSVSLRVGNAGGVLVTLNGDFVGALGTGGEVIDQEWILEGAVLSTPTPGPSPTPTETSEVTVEATGAPTAESTAGVTQETPAATTTPGGASG